MKFYKVRDEILSGKSIYQLPLRVTFYARVSTESDVQLNSLENQKQFFEQYITDNPNWTYVKGYVDEGISGNTVKKRKKFLQMIEDAKEGYFDLIITKEVSRFSRNLADSIKYTQELILNNVGVYFQSNAINTYDPNSEFVLNMMGSVAQEEVKRLSTRIKWGHKQAIKNGRILGTNNILGYVKNNAHLIIDDEEAKIVKRIFELYATEKYGFYKLAIKLHNEGINNRNGNIFDKETLKRIIKNPKYKGYYRGHTTEIIDYKTKQRIHIPTNEQIIYKDESIPAIVKEELWDRANTILNNRSNLMKENKGNAKKIERKYSYTSKVYCSEHNTSYQRIINKNNPKWACSKYVKYRVKECVSPIIHEIDLDTIFLDLIDKIFCNKKEIVDEMISYYSNIKLTNNSKNDIFKLKNEIEKINSKKEKILDLTIDGSLSNEEFKFKNIRFNEEINKLKDKINNIKNISSINNIELLIQKEINNKNNIKDFTDKFLEKIIVYKLDENRHNLKLNIYLNFLKKDIKTNSKKESILIYINDYDSVIKSRSNYIKNSFYVNVFLI